MLLMLSLTTSFTSFATDLTLNKNLDLSLPDFKSKPESQDGNDCINPSKPKRVILANEVLPKTLNPTDQYYVRSIIDKVEKLTNNMFITNEIRMSKGSFYAQVEVIVLSTGEACEPNILKSSGSATFNEMVVNAVKRSSPFAPFPKEISNKYNSIRIVRTWTYPKI